MELSQKLKELRKKQGLTQLELAERLFVSRQAISGWEAGTSRPSTENLQSLSRLFNIPLETLLDDTAEAEPAAAPEMNGFRPGWIRGFQRGQCSSKRKRWESYMGFPRMTRITLSRPSETVKRLNGAEGIGCETSTSPRLITMN